MLSNKFKFLKFHVCGNDYIFFDVSNQNIKNPSELSKKLSDRHFGIGSDGIILIKSSKIADSKITMFNSDGSEGKMCGNGISCVAKILCKKLKKNEITIEMSALKKIVKIKKQKDLFKTEMDPPIFLKTPQNINGIDVFCVSMGNPHCVVFCEAFQNLNILGPQIENCKIFPEKTNVEFVKIINNKKIILNIWERGSGKTLSCGSGALAAISVACKKKYLLKNKKILIKLQRGEIFAKYTENKVFLYTKPNKVFEGIIKIND